MRSLSRVVWSEGMYLGPHHFQAQSRYFEDSTKFATSSLWFAPYGVAGCALDSDALQNGTVAVLHARGILGDGLPFEMPECDELPPARALADLFPPTPPHAPSMTRIPAPTSARSAWDARTCGFCSIPSRAKDWLHCRLRA